MSSIFSSALHVVDAGLENVSLLADAASRSAAPVPAVTSDFDDKASESFLHRSIDAIRGQFQRGVPIEVPPLQLIVCHIFLHLINPCVNLSSRYL